MTEKLFWINPYLTEYDSKITSINENKVKLDKTIFYAFSGGQSSDEGTISNIKVVNAVKQGDKESLIDIEYELENKPDFNVGDVVKIQIDKERRLKLMKLHSAVHIMYYFAIEKLGKIKIIGSNISPEKARVDFSYDSPINEIVSQIEKELNEFISKNVEIEMKNDKANKDLCWWVCNNWKMPCGGTHVKNTSEIGKIKLKRKNIGAGKERIELTLV